MQLSDILGLLGGLALFLYGMTMMSEGLEEGAGKRLESILETLTNHKLKAIFIGIIVTCLIQSSSAMTVMLIGFINAKLIDLKRAIWVIMGANIGTTITGQIIALKIGVLAPLFAIIGVILIVFVSSRFFNHIGKIIGGLGILFMGLEFMSISMQPLGNSQIFLKFMSRLSHPLLAIIAGAIFTAIIQSSSAAIGILQTLAMQGLLELTSGAYMIFGLNIGTCITAFLASLSGCQNAKRLTYFHMIFNTIGTLIFTVLCLLTPFIQIVINITPLSPMTQLANMHTLFNVGTTFILLFFDKYIIRFVSRI